MKNIFFFTLLIFGFLTLSCKKDSNTESLNFTLKSQDLMNNFSFINYNRWYPDLSVFGSEENLKHYNSDYYDTFKKFKLESNNNDLSWCYFDSLSNQIVVLAKYIGNDFRVNSNTFQSKVEFKKEINKLLGKNLVVPKLKIVNTNISQSNIKKIGEISTTLSGPTGLYEFSPNLNKSNKNILLYLEGHGGSSIDAGKDHLLFFDSLGFRVFFMDMPLVGLNSVNTGFVAKMHNDYFKFENTNNSSPLWSEFIAPIGSSYDYLKNQFPNSNIMIGGRSGGGYLSYLSGTLFDFDYVISIAGGAPLSYSLRTSNGPYEFGDYEQFTPRIFNILDMKI